MIEVFNLFFKAMVDGGLISSFAVEGKGGRGVKSHLLFADTLIFCGGTMEKLRWLGVTLLLFKSVSGLKINLQKK